MLRCKFLIVCFLLDSVCFAQAKMDSTDVLGIPNWFLSPPVSSEYCYGTGQAKCARKKDSENLALERAKKNIATQIGAIFRVYYYDVGWDSHEYADVEQKLEVEDLKKVRVLKMEFAEDGRCYVLCCLSFYEINQIIKKGEKNEKM